LIAREEAEKIYTACQITHLLEKDTRALSGGEKQRVALAKLLLRSPKLLLLDEPFSNLDYIHKHIIKHVIEDVEQKLGTTVMLVAHDPVDVLSWAQRVCVLRNGKIVQEAEPRTIYHHPDDTYVAGLFGAYSLITSENWPIPNKTTFTRLSDKLMIRPEHFVISKGGVSGRVATVRYCGAYDQVEIKIKKEVVLMNTPVGKLSVGKKVSMAIKEEI
jgi:ABC-type sugar transport system ATPase subunit